MTYRTDVVELLPWVTKLSHGRRCDAYRPMSQKARQDAELREHYRCLGVALWHFTALPPSQYIFNGTSGYYCWAHLMACGVKSSMDEDGRARLWWDQHLDAVNDVRERYGKSALPAEVKS